jgi:phage protein D
MTAQPLEALVHGVTTFYVPRYKVLLGGQELHAQGGDFLSVQFKDSIKGELSGFELSLNNWDDAGEGGNPRFKYSDDDRVIKLGQSVDVQMGYQDDASIESMMVGEITALDPQFPSSGAPTITVRGLDKLHRLRNRPRTRSWDNKSDCDIARQIANNNQLGGFEGDATSPTHTHVPQNNVDDLAFLVERARRIDFEVFIRNGKLLFRRPRDTDDPVVRLDWGSSLISFTPSLTLARQVSKVTVRSWDRARGELLHFTVNRSDLSAIASGGRNAGQVLDEALGEPKEEIITREGITSQEDARALAESVLRRSSYAFVTGTAQTIGYPKLRAGTTVQLAKLGARFDGKYYITDSTHRIDGNGYQTTLGVRKVSTDERS